MNHNLLLPNGMDFTTRKPLTDAIPEQEFGERIQRNLEGASTELRDLARLSTTGATFRGEIERVRPPDLGDPRAAGWTYLINGEDPQRDEIIEVIRPLAEFRGMADPSSPLIYNDEPFDEWWDWLIENYSPLALGSVPYYVCIIGGPGMVPFRFQSFISSASAVGRLDFDADLNSLVSYINKILRIEQADQPAAKAHAVCFATDEGLDDVTYFSRRYMASPMAEVMRKSRTEVHALFGAEATKAALSQALISTRPGLVFTASHGLGALSESYDVQRRYNGAICCQSRWNSPLEEWLFSAADVPLDESFLDGAIFFQFACFSYGTPAESDFVYWINLQLPNAEAERLRNAESDFVAALPKRLLAHPQVPVGFIGHVDLAWMHGFTDPEHPYLIEKWHPRISPFVVAVEQLLASQPMGLAMRDMAKKFDIGNSVLSTTFERLQRGKIKPTSEFYARLADAFITRSDAANYHIFGDPAARARMMEE